MRRHALHEETRKCGHAKNCELFYKSCWILRVALSFGVFIFIGQGKARHTALLSLDMGLSLVTRVYMSVNKANNLYQ